jgi:hypothetical protein
MRVSRPANSKATIGNPVAAEKHGRTHEPSLPCATVDCAALVMASRLSQTGASALPTPRRSGSSQ